MNFESMTGTQFPAIVSGGWNALLRVCCFAFATHFSGPLCESPCLCDPCADCM